MLLGWKKYQKEILKFLIIMLDKVKDQTEFSLSLLRDISLLKDSNPDGDFMSEMCESLVKLQLNHEYCVIQNVSLFEKAVVLVENNTQLVKEFVK